LLKKLLAFASDRPAHGRTHDPWLSGLAPSCPVLRSPVELAGRLQPIATPDNQSESTLGAARDISV
jgi:hypothetical protein